MPLRDLKESLDQRTGYGLGAQWTHEHGDWHASRTRLEWNTFPESGPVGAAGTKTYAKNYILSFDHLFKLNTGTTQAYVVGGLGGARWCLEQTTATTYDSRWTTKLAITGGVGVQFANRVNLEARYVVSSVGKTFDANTLQASLGFRF
jgi:opacity protein-like surface antigen